MTVTCVDLSKYQEGFNFSAFKQSGGLGVILKASEGETDADPCYADFRAQAASAGLSIASYHYFDASDPATQAEFYLDCATPGEGERVVCDWEDDATSPDMVVSFLQSILEARPDLQLTVYSGATAKDKLGSTKNAWLAANTSLWLAQYTTGTPSWAKATWAQWSLWQYDDQHPVPGFSGAVDQNRFNGSDANFLKWMGPAVAPPAPAPTPEASAVITISSDKPVQIRLGPNVAIAAAS